MWQYPNQWFLFHQLQYFISFSSTLNIFLFQESPASSFQDVLTTTSNNSWKDHHHPRVLMVPVIGQLVNMKNFRHHDIHGDHCSAVQIKTKKTISHIWYLETIRKTKGHMSLANLQHSKLYKSISIHNPSLSNVYLFL